jgi:type II secretory pathway pseudopilin PulG
MKSTSPDSGYSLFELIIASAVFISLTSVALVTSSKLIATAKLHSQAKATQTLISNAIFSAYKQKSKLTLSISPDAVRMFRNTKLIDQIKAPPSIYYSKVNKVIEDPWIEDIYPTGSQSPFSLQINNKTDACIISVSLRGRVSSKCL